MRHRRTLIAWAGVLALIAGSPSSEAQAPRSLTVSAGDLDRRDSVVPVVTRARGGTGFWMLHDDAGRTTPLQVGPDGRGAFILGELKAGQTRTYRLARAGSVPAGGVQVVRDGGMLKV